MKLRDYQQQSVDKINLSWKQCKNVLLVLPTGAGKTVTFAHVIKENAKPCVAIAHRQELVGQISVALAREGVKHNILSPKKVIKSVINKHVRQLGKSFYDPNSHFVVAGIDTLLRRNGTGDDGDFYAHKIDRNQFHVYGPKEGGTWPKNYEITEKRKSKHLTGNKKPIDADPKLYDWAKSVDLWVTDEAHHLLKSNKWGRGVEIFKNAKGLGVTATPTRADGNGLGSHHDGVFDDMVVGPSMRELIDMGMLTDYRIICPPSDLLLEDVPLGADGDYTREGLRKAMQKSKIVGDVVSHYLKHAKGKRGVTFTPTVEDAEETAAAYNAAGVPGLAVSADTPDSEREAAIRKLENGEILQLVNVDLFGEGFDLPAIEVISMARPTRSLSLYIQQFGRSLRLMEGKKTALVIDHVGNVGTEKNPNHGLPDAVRNWTLDRREKRTKGADSDAIPTTTCVSCLSPYERIYKACPFCGHYEPPSATARTSPEFVDGDLIELDAETLKRMRGEVAKIDKSPDTIYHGLIKSTGNKKIANSAAKIHRIRQEYQAGLRRSIEWWAGFRRQEGLNDSEINRLFYLKFKVDLLTAQSLGKKEASKLVDKINKTFVDQVNKEMQ